MRVTQLGRWSLVVCLMMAASRAGAGDVLSPPQERFAASGDAPSRTEEGPNFRRHVIPLLGRLGCNGRSCHGSFQGQGGFRLSMFGFDFAADHQALSARSDVAAPDESLILYMPTSPDEHGGGERFKKGGWEHHLLRRWIQEGAKDDSPRAGKLVRLDVSPSEILFDRPGERRQLRAVAHWSDGTREDVTCLTRFSSKNDSIATVSGAGLVESTGKGSTFVTSSYDSTVAATQVLLPVSEWNGEHFPDNPAPTHLDELVLAQLRKLGVVPSPPTGDAEFLRRVSLDVTGTLPTPNEVQAFIADPSPDKRRRKIDELLNRPAYVAWWTTKLCDLTGLNGNAQLGGTEIAKYAGELWHRWIERRVRDNVGYDQIVRGILQATSRRPGQAYEEYVQSMTSYFRKADTVDFAEEEMMPFYWFRANLVRPEDKALAVAYSFMGVRLDCAQCHKHPFDRWSQQDFRQFTAFFDRVSVGYAADAEQTRRRLEEAVGLKDLKNAKERRGKYRKLAQAGEAIVPWREVYVAPREPDDQAITPKLLGGNEPKIAPGQDPREPLMKWLLARDNPYFARAMVNRVWAHYFGVGIVDPPDDFNLANPPANPQLLTWLAEEFVDHGYDMKWLHHTITSSRTYQSGFRPNETNRLDRRHFSHALPRRLPAEVLIDAIEQATASRAMLSRAHLSAAGRRIGEQPPAKMRGLEYGLAIFGKPIREVNCDCERQSAPSLQQAIYMRNDKDLWDMIDRPDGWVQEVDASTDPDELIHEAYLRTLSRRPTEREVSRCREQFATCETSVEALRDVLWALLNTQEFVTNK